MRFSTASLCDKNMKTLIVTSIIIVITIITVPLSCKYIEEPHTYYKNYTKELHNGFWVPDIFPTDIREIHEQHAIDSNQVWVKFTLSDLEIDLSKFKKMNKSIVPYKKPFLSTWWFNDLPEHYNLYKGSCGESSTSTIAISKSSKTVYWWCE